MAEYRYIADACSLIDLIAGRRSLTKPRQLTQLVKERRLRVPESVVREVLKKDDPLKRWVTNHRAGCELEATDGNTAEMTRLARQYRDYLTGTRTGADAMVVAMGLYYRDSEWTIVTGDGAFRRSASWKAFNT